MNMPNRKRLIEILLVEDSPTDRLIAVEALQQAKILNSLNVVENGVEAMAYLRREGKYSGALRPDLILLDLNLPRKDGREVLQEIKGDPYFKFIPVVVLTTSRAEADVVRAYGLHANSYITKPVDFTRFSEVISSIENYWFEVVTLPSDPIVHTATPANAPSPLERQTQPDEDRVIQVLLAEDNPADTLMVREALRESMLVRFNLTQVERLSELREKLLSGAFDVVLTDLGLPDSQGLDTYRQIRPWAGALPVIVLTGLNDEAMGIAALREGAQEYLVKSEMMETTLPRVLRYALEKKRSEVRLQQAHKMEAIGRIAAGVAHDFNNILSAMIMHAELATTMEANPQEVRQAIIDIKGYAERAAHLTRQLLTFSRQQVLLMKPLELNEVVGGIGKMLRRVLSEEVSLELRLDSALPKVEADCGMLEQAVLNLAINAQDAMPSGGKLTIQTSTIQVSPGESNRPAGAYAGSFVCLSVTDTGCGMSPEVMSRIFEPFFTTKDVGKGTGLGLATVYSILQQHRGWVEVQSRVAVGTTFHLFLPASTALPPQAAVPPPSAVPRGSETVLIVEDEDAVRMLVKLMLERQGYRVLEARSGAEAKALYESQLSQIDLLFTDMVMPDGLNGRQLADAFKAIRPSLKVIFSSGYSQDFLSKDFHLEEGVNYLAKPYPLTSLLKIVRTRLDHP